MEESLKKMYTSFKTFIFSELEIKSGISNETMMEAIGWADIKEITFTPYNSGPEKEPHFVCVIIYQELGDE